jgi:sulfur relay (sulfurtransferase) DsrC/TusE family protein
MAEEGSLDLAVADIEAALAHEPDNKELQGLHTKALRMVRQYIDKHDSQRMSRVMIQEVDASDGEEEGEEEEEEKVEEGLAELEHAVRLSPFAQSRAKGDLKDGLGVGPLQITPPSAISSHLLD